ncbi:MAG: ABC transporter substrate-binding protein [Deltaproteobacteria bacterium]|nr:MAG: ABC transporter substrate-binding protein [Deltaproteobacteria bacterium]
MRQVVAAALVLAGLVVLPHPARASGAAKALEKPVKTLITAVRYGKDSLGIKQLAGEAQARFLLGEAYEKATEAQRAEFIRLFHQLFAGIAFPKIRQNFEHLETILYEPPEIEGDTAKMKSTLVILHPLKKQEIRVEYTLKKVGKRWKVFDVLVLGTGGDSMLTSIRNDQVQPILAEGGMDHLLKLMRERAAEIEKAKQG